MLNNVGIINFINFRWITIFSGLKILKLSCPMCCVETMDDLNADGLARLKQILIIMATIPVVKVSHINVSMQLI